MAGTLKDYLNRMPVSFDFYMKIERLEERLVEGKLIFWKPYEKKSTIYVSMTVDDDCPIQLSPLEVLLCAKGGNSASSWKVYTYVVLTETTRETILFNDFIDGHTVKARAKRAEKDPSIDATGGGGVEDLAQRWIYLGDKVYYVCEVINSSPHSWSVRVRDPVASRELLEVELLRTSMHCASTARLKKSEARCSTMWGPLVGPSSDDTWRTYQPKYLKYPQLWSVPASSSIIPDVAPDVSPHIAATGNEADDTQMMMVADEVVVEEVATILASLAGPSDMEGVQQQGMLVGIVTSAEPEPDERSLSDQNEGGGERALNTDLMTFAPDASTTTTTTSTSVDDASFQKAQSLFQLLLVPRLVWTVETRDILARTLWEALRRDCVRRGDGMVAVVVSQRVDYSSWASSTTHATRARVVGYLSQDHPHVVRALRAFLRSCYDDHSLLMWNFLDRLVLIS